MKIRNSALGNQAQRRWRQLLSPGLALASVSLFTAQAALSYLDATDNPITLTRADGTVVTSSGFASFVVTSSVRHVGGDHPWQFTYDFEVTRPHTRPGRDPLPLPWTLSHFILEVSYDSGGPNRFTAADLLETHWEGPRFWGPGTPGDSSTPGMPGQLYGIKLNFTGPQPTDGRYQVVIHSTRAPMLGDFYAKQAQADYAYNAGFGLPPGAIPYHKIWVPDTTSAGPGGPLIPEPQEYALAAALGLLGFAFARRRRVQLAH